MTRFACRGCNPPCTLDDNLEDKTTHLPYLCPFNLESEWHPEVTS